MRPLARVWCALLVGVMAGVLALPVRAQQTISEARDAGVGASVTVEGTVTRAHGDFVRLQDDSGPTGASGLVVRQTSGSFRQDVEEDTIRAGTQLEVSGTLSEFRGLLQINEGDLSSYTVQGQGSVPSAQTVSLSEIADNGEDYESELIRATGLTVQGASGTFENNTSYTVEGGSGALTFRVQGPDETAIGGEPIPDGAFDYVGVVGEFEGDYQLIPVQPGDLQSTLSFSFNKMYTLAQEGRRSVTARVQAFNTRAGEEVSVTAEISEASTASASDISGFQSPRTFTFSGSDAKGKEISVDVVDDRAQEGVERLEIELSSDDGAVAAPGRFTVWILDDATAQAPVAAGDSGDVLLNQLQQRFGDPPTLGYDIARDSLYRRIYNDQGTVETIYSGLKISVDPEGGDASDQALDQNVNTEHIWPRSQGAGEEPALSNLHILAPALDAVNSARSNYAFGEIPDVDTDSWYFEDRTQSSPPSEAERPAWSELDSSPSSREDRRFEPRHRSKGNVARAAFYFAMAYPNRANLQFFEAQRETLLEWHRSDPVDSTEMRRTLLQASYQGNKVNPFVLDSTLATRAYGRGGQSGGDVLTVREARSLGGGRTATVEGIVTRVGSEGVYLQDDTGGLYIFESEGEFGQNLGGVIRRGTRLQVSGSLQYYNGLLELTDVPEDGYQVVSQDNSLPEAVGLSLGEIADQGEEYEAELVRAENVAIQADGTETFAEGNYTIEDGTGSMTLRIPDGSPLVGEAIPARATFQGVLGQFNDAGVDADTPDSGYQLMGVDVSDLTTLLPRHMEVDITRSFGAPGSAESYGLVALPGDVDRGLASTLSGEPGLDWQAYWDDGSDQDFFVRFDGGDRFSFRPGRGFWLLSTSDWSVSTTIGAVQLSDGAAQVPLHEGWNIVSNPLPRSVAWSEVEAATGTTLQPLWQWNDGQFGQVATFASAAGGEAFYFLNDQGLDQLSIPLVETSEGGSAQVRASGWARRVVLTARRSGETPARVRVGEHVDALEGRDPRDWVAPPSRFADVSLHLRPSSDVGARPREQRWAREARPTGASGQSYSLVLRADSTAPVTLRAEALPERSQTRVVLVDSVTGERYDLRRRASVELDGGATPRTFRLHVGTASYVEQRQAEHRPETFSVRPPAPNPFRERTTFRYALPEATHVRVAVYDLLGRRVRLLVDERQAAGPHRATWKGQNGAGQPLASGTYFVRWSAGGDERVEKVVLVR